MQCDGIVDLEVLRGDEILLPLSTYSWGSSLFYFLLPNQGRKENKINKIKTEKEIKKEKRKRNKKREKRKQVLEMRHSFHSTCSSWGSSLFYFYFYSFLLFLFSFFLFLREINFLFLRNKKK
jgi:hypothetical protein